MDLYCAIYSVSGYNITGIIIKKKESVKQGVRIGNICNIDPRKNKETNEYSDKKSEFEKLIYESEDAEFWEI